MKLKIAEQDIVYLSYDEPNAEKHYADLLTKVPWAKRVHGVKGSDSAHKACAELSETDRFITIDGDNRIRPNFLNQEINFEEHTDLQSCVISWAGKNIVNGLMYGNGGIKCWPKDFVLKIISKHGKCLRFVSKELKNEYSEYPVGHGVAPQNFFSFKKWIENRL